MNAAELLQRRAAERPGQVAIVATAGGRRERSITFAALADSAARRAARLRDGGVGPGASVLMLVPVSVELYASLIAVLHAGATATFLDPSAGLGHVARCCAMRPPEAVIGSLRSLPLRVISRPLRRVPRWFRAGRVGDTRPMSAVERDDADPAVMTFTSGSTGQPKAAVRSHGVLRAQGKAIAAEFDLIAGDRDLTTLPMFVLANLAAGVTSVLPDVDLRHSGHADPRPVLAALKRHRCQTTAGSPALLERLADAGVRLDSLRGVFVGGAPVMPRIVDKLRTAAPNARIVSVYGSTEAEPMCAIDAADVSEADHAHRRNGGGLLAGRPTPPADVRVIADRWGRPLGPITQTEFDAMRAEVGEVVVAGPHVLGGYLHGVGDAETKIRVGNETWHRTGDAGRFDNQGRLWLLGRCAARVGETYPLQVEAAVADATTVARSAFVEHRGRRILLVQPADWRGRDAAVADARAALPATIRVDDVIAVRSIPVDRRHNAKVDYPALHRLLNSGV